MHHAPFIASFAMQSGDPDKAKMLQAIAEYFDIPSYACMALFDDKIINEVWWPSCLPFILKFYID